MLKLFYIPGYRIRICSCEKPANRPGPLYSNNRLAGIGLDFAERSRSGRKKQFEYESDGSGFESRYNHVFSIDCTNTEPKPNQYLGRGKLAFLSGCIRDFSTAMSESFCSALLVNGIGRKDECTLR